MGTVLSLGAVTTYEQVQIQKMERAVASASFHSPLRANYRLAQALSFHGGIDIPDVGPITDRRSNLNSLDTLEYGTGDMGADQ
jgi:hypothetical protein